MCFVLRKFQYVVQPYQMLLSDVTIPSRDKLRIHLENVQVGSWDNAEALTTPFSWLCDPSLLTPVILPLWFDVKFVWKYYVKT